MASKKDTDTDMEIAWRFLRGSLWLVQKLPIVDTFWVAVKELNLSYYIGETLLFTIYTHYGNLI